MLLENKYYRVIHVNGDGLNAIFHIALLPDCDIYRGHFPGNPVSPGVCNIETVRECAMLLTGKKLFISFIKQCRLMAVASPVICPEVDVVITASPTEAGFTVQAKITDAKRVYMEYKGEMSI